MAAIYGIERFSDGKLQRSLFEENVDGVPLDNSTA
jgi:hypothetical protein